MAKTREERLEYYRRWFRQFRLKTRKQVLARREQIKNTAATMTVEK